MGITDFWGQLMRSVGNNMDNDPQDVLNTKQNLRNAGYLEDGQQELETPFITRKMDDGIRAFQCDKNLKVDGIMKPGGETERGLFEFLTKQKADDVFGKVVLQNGWLPAKGLPPYENISAVAHDFRDFGYTEVLDCAGAGATSPCIFYFQNSGGKYLKIGTEGEHISLHASPRVVYTEILNQID